jgi:hypothetical protein
MLHVEPIVPCFHLNILFMLEAKLTFFFSDYRFGGTIIGTGSLPGMSKSLWADSDRRSLKCAIFKLCKVIHFIYFVCLLNVYLNYKFYEVQWDEPSSII